MAKKKKKSDEEYEKEKKEIEWKDLNENSKYICERGIITCKHCSATDAKIKVTSNTISLQDVPWVTSGDNNGKVNFQFQGVCKKISGSNKPPCLSVINLTGWKNTSETHIQDFNALRMDSYNICSISGDKLKFKDCGQRALLYDPQDVFTDGGQYFVDAEWMRDPNFKSTVKDMINNSPVYLCIKMKNTEKITDKVIEIAIHDEDNKEQKLTIAKADKKIYPIDSSSEEVHIGFNLKIPNQKASLFIVCRVRDENGNLEEVRLPRNQENYLTVHPSICLDRWRMIGLNEIGTDIANDMTYGFCKIPQFVNLIKKEDESAEDYIDKRQIYSEEDVEKYKKEYAEGVFDFTNHDITNATYIETQTESLSFDIDVTLPQDNTYVVKPFVPDVTLPQGNTYVTKPFVSDITLPQDNTYVAKPFVPNVVVEEDPSLGKMRYTEKSIREAQYKSIVDTGEIAWSYKEYAEKLMDSRTIESIKKMILDSSMDTLAMASISPFLWPFYDYLFSTTEENWQLLLGELNTVPKFLFWRFRTLVGRYFDYGELQGNIGAMIDKFERSEGGIYETKQLSENLAKNPATERFCIQVDRYIEFQMMDNEGDITSLIDNKIYFFKIDDLDERNRKEKTFSLSYTWSFNFEGLGNVLGGRTIALNDIWAREVHIQSIEWKDEFTYRVKYLVILWDHFGLDLPDLEKAFNALPIASEIFASWFLLQHCYGYKPFVTKASFVKEFEGDIRTCKITEEEIQKALAKEAEIRRKEEEAMKAIISNINVWQFPGFPQ